MASQSSPTILVTGDFVLERHIYAGQRRHFGDRRHRGVQERTELGGAALVHYLLSKLGGVESRSSVKVDDERNPVLPPGGRVPPELCSYAVWRPFGPEGEKAPGNLVWRTKDPMGFGCIPPAEGAEFRWPAADSLPKRPDVVAISDGGMGFRCSPEDWPGDGTLNAAKWIVLKTAEPLAEGPLWEQLSAPKFRSKLVVVASSAALRRSEARISTGLSWDATVESVLAAFDKSGELADLAKCRHLLLSFETEGGLWLDLARNGPRAHLVYDAEAVEGEHGKPGKGKAFGALSCLAASAAWRLAKNADAPDLESALEGGLSAMSDLLKNGHDRASAEGKGYPANRLAKAVKEATCRYARAAFHAKDVSSAPPCPAQAAKAAAPCWSVVHAALRQQGQQCPEPAYDLAELVAQRGPVALGSLPHLAIGKLTSADRRESESLRGLRRLIVAYKERDASKCKKPLSVGVFGPPGAGKSFAVKEIARTLVGGEGWMEFNLSQFKPGTDDLIGAFHQIRDRALRHQIPVAFFDEFDSREYAWLQYLLAPMQDGAFQEGQITHPIGKCVFVFAGATSQTFASFGPPEKDADAYARFRLAKGPDFKSRLDGFLDVLGPNRRDVVRLSKDGREYKPVPDPCDIFFPVRRALVLRAEMGCGANDKLAMDRGLLRALLRVGRYVHGARSMSKVTEPLKVVLPGTVRRSDLPPRQQLDLHVDADEFLSLLRQTPPAPPAAELPPDAKEVMADAIHETWRKLGLDQGWIEPGGDGDVDYGTLSERLKDSNRAAADRMVHALALVGLTLEPGENAPAEAEALRLKIECNLELLADAEHEGWMDWHLDQGWQLGPKKDEKNKTHPCLKPYLDLSDEDRHKDRNTIRHYAGYAAKAGMRIVHQQSSANPKQAKAAPARNRKRRP